jgi:nitrate reductase NapD
MTISSAVVKTSPKFLNSLVDILNNSGLCEVFEYDEFGRIIIVLEGNSVGEESEKLKAISQIDGVLSAQMVVSYNEDEMETLRENLNSNYIVDLLNRDDIDARDIKYPTVD